MILKKQRKHQTFRASGPIRAMIENEMRSTNGDRTRAIENLIVFGGGAKYPKLMERFKILRMEAA